MRHTRKLARAARGAGQSTGQVHELATLSPLPKRQTDLVLKTYKAQQRLTEIIEIGLTEFFFGTGFVHIPRAAALLKRESKTIA